MKIFSTSQVAALDRFTIENEPVSELGLMERASTAIAGWLAEKFAPEQKLVCFAGPGNNGGDAVTVTRMLLELGFSCRLFILANPSKLKESTRLALGKLAAQQKVEPVFIQSEADFPVIEGDTILVDGLFGSGLNRPLSGLAAALVCHINHSGATVAAIDIPSGLMGEGNQENNPDTIVCARYTLCLQFPKLSVLFVENECFAGEWVVLPIGLSQFAIDATETPYHFLTDSEAVRIIRVRSRFAHKGNFGRALLIAGSQGKMGAAVLAARACLRSGAGLLTVHVPHRFDRVLYGAVPEAMCSVDTSEYLFTEFPALDGFDAVGVGPGLGMENNTEKALLRLLEAKPKKLVLDADALNILAKNRQWLSELPANSILTPHPKEFERLAGASSNSFERLQKQRAFSETYQVIIVLKGAWSSISFPGGQVVFNSSGNPGMATAGSGDVLTGVLTGLLAQGYCPKDAAVLGVFLHGLSGDMAAAGSSQEAILAGDIVEGLGAAFSRLKGLTNGH